VIPARVTDVCHTGTVLRGVEVGEEEEHELRVYQNMALRRTSGSQREKMTERWEKTE
jgi:hypothetical protein